MKVLLLLIAFSASSFSENIKVYDSSYATITRVEEEFKSHKDSADLFINNAYILRKYATPRIDSLKSYKESHASLLRFDSLKLKMINDSISYYKSIYTTLDIKLCIDSLKIEDSTLIRYTQTSTLKYSPIITLKKYTPMVIVNDTSPVRGYIGKTESGKFIRRTVVSNDIFDTVIIKSPRTIEKTMVYITYNEKIYGDFRIFTYNGSEIIDRDTIYTEIEYPRHGLPITKHYNFGVRIIPDIQVVESSDPPKNISGPIIGTCVFMTAIAGVVMSIIFGGEGTEH